MWFQHDNIVMWVYTQCKLPAYRILLVCAELIKNLNFKIRKMLSQLICRKLHNIINHYNILIFYFIGFIGGSLTITVDLNLERIVKSLHLKNIEV
jgi:hypothetical protein